MKNNFKIIVMENEIRHLIVNIKLSVPKNISTYTNNDLINLIEKLIQNLDSLNIKVNCVTEFITQSPQTHE